MQITEFSDNFDVLVNSFAATIGFGEDTSKAGLSFTEYEKSVFLTDSQNDLVLGLYTGRSPLGEGFESTEELRRYLAPLMVEAELIPEKNITGNPIGIDSKHKFFTLPDGSSDKPAVWFITYEAAVINNGSCDGKSDKLIDVYPVKQDEYNKIKRNPFRGANNRRALRLDLSDGVVEIVSTYTEVSKYYIRYIRKPKPIVLTDLPDGLTVDGKSTESVKCELPDSLHQRILERAVQAALQSRGYNKQEK